MAMIGVGQNGQVALTATPFPLLGKCGVDVFFVLSGLLMWRTTAQGPQRIATFYGRRLLRIVPLYWAVTGVAVALALLLPGLLKSTRVEPLHVAASLLFIPWPNPAMGGGTDLVTPLVVPGWTLNFEIAFYLLFGLTLPAPLRWRLPANLLLFGLCMALVLAFRSRSQLLAFYDPSLVLEFVVGLGLGAILDRRLLIPLPWAGALLPAAAVALCWFDATPPGTGRFIATTLPALAVLFAVASLDLARRWPVMPLMMRIGDASFSLYLTHVFVLAALRAGFVHFGAPLTRPATQTMFVAASLVLSCLIGVLVYRFIERPLGTALRRGSGRHHSSAVRASSGSAGGALSVLSTASTDLTSSSRLSGF